MQITGSGWRNALLAAAVSGLALNLWHKARHERASSGGLPG